MLGDQEIGEIDEVGEARIEQQVPASKFLFYNYQYFLCSCSFCIEAFFWGKCEGFLYGSSCQ